MSQRLQVSGIVFIICVVIVIVIVIFFVFVFAEAYPVPNQVVEKVKCQPNYLTTRVKNWRRNQYTSSIIDTKLIPRQSPQSPPRFEMKSSQVILRDLSNSEEWKMNIKV